MTDHDVHSAAEIVWSAPGEDRTVELGRRLASLLVAGDVVALEGPLGTGKTRVVRGIAEGLGLGVEVTSPTFSVVHEYGGDPPLSHVDAYRLADGDEFLSLGASELWEDGVVVIEWASRVADVLPPETLWISGETMTGGRVWRVEPNCPRHAEARAALTNEAFDR